MASRGMAQGPQPCVAILSRRWTCRATLSGFQALGQQLQDIDLSGRPPALVLDKLMRVVMAKARVGGGHWDLVCCNQCG